MMLQWGICLAYYIIANINKCWHLGACRGAPEAAASDEQRVCRPASVEEPCKEHLGWAGEERLGT